MVKNADYGLKMGEGPAACKKRGLTFKNNSDKECAQFPCAVCHPPAKSVHRSRSGEAPG